MTRNFDLAQKSTSAKVAANLYCDDAIKESSPQVRHAIQQAFVAGVAWANQRTIEDARWRLRAAAKQIGVIVK